MAERLMTFDFTSPSDLTKSDKATYPWHEWLDGDIWQLRYGEDFHTHPLMMERIIRTRATGRKARVKLRHLPQNGDEFGVIVLQRWDIKGPELLKKQEAKEKRAAKKAAAKEAAEETLLKAGMKPAESTPAEPVKSLSKVPTKRPTRKRVAKA